MANEQLEIFKLISNPNSKVIILLPASQSADQPSDAVQAFLNTDFGFGIETKWGTLSPPTSFQEGATDIVNQGITAFNAWAAAHNTDSIVRQRHFLSLFQTVASWQGTTKPIFDLALYFFALRENDDIRRAVFKLLKGVSPIKDTAITLFPPFGYNVAIAYNDKNFEGIQGTCSLKIGRWFEAPHLVMRSVTPIFSKETTPEGLPLFARVQVSFEPAILWTVEDIKGLFPGFTEYEQSLQYEASPGEGASSTGEDKTSLGASDDVMDRWAAGITSEQIYQPGPY